MPDLKNKPLRVVELFAGVGGFRLGLEGYDGMSPSSKYKNPMPRNFEVVWSNQWEPSTKIQHANEVYLKNWPTSNHNTENIEEIIDRDPGLIPEHDLLVGGFPCQDYSVATTLKSSKGLIGKKGILWWSIYSILEHQGENRPKYLMLENVDRLLGSPANQRGRDFAVMLSCLNKLGYNAEWRVINAAHYGMPQRRKRVFIIGYLNSTSISNKLNETDDLKEWLTRSGLIASYFHVENETGPTESFNVRVKPETISKTFGVGQKKSQFKNTGVLLNGKVFSLQTKPILLSRKTLRSILFRGKINEDYFINPSKKISKILKKPQIGGKTKILRTELDMWNYLKGAKKEWRITSDRNDHSKQHRYRYAEGKMTYPDDKDQPSRTIITAEGGTSPSRFKHVIKVGKKFRRLLPIELERLNMFPNDHTKHPKITDAKRAFFMGNALVVGIVEILGKGIYRFHNDL